MEILIVLYIIGIAFTYWFDRNHVACPDVMPLGAIVASLFWPWYFMILLIFYTDLII